MTLTVTSKAFDDAIGRVAHAMAPDEGRPILSGFLLEGDAAGLRVVAADNYRLAIADVADGDFSAFRFGGVVVPRDQVPVLRAFLKVRKRDVTIESLPPHLVVADSYGSVTLRTIDGKFPDYRVLLHKKRGDRQVVGINPAFLTDAARALPKGLPMAVSVPTAKGGLGAAVLVTVRGYTEIIMPVRMTGALGGIETIPEPVSA